MNQYDQWEFERLCHHEAGHLVASEALGMSHGPIYVNPNRQGIDRGHMVCGSGYDSPRNEAVMSVAGWCAEERWQEMHTEAQCDRRQLSQLADYGEALYHIERGNHMFDIDSVIEEARGLVLSHWGHIASVGSGLFRRTGQGEHKASAG